MEIGIVSGRQFENAVHHDDGSVYEKGLMDMAHPSGGARGTSCHSSGKQIESTMMSSWPSVNGSRRTARHDGSIEEVSMDLLEPGSHGEHDGDEME